MKALWLCAITLIAQGCSILFAPSPVPIRYFRLQEPQCERSNTPLSPTIRVDRVSAESPIDGTRILYAKNDLEVGFYQYAFWVSSPATQFERVIKAALACELPDHEGSGKTPSYSVRVHLIELIHDARSSPGVSRVTAHLKLLTTDESKEVASTTLQAIVPVAQYSAESAVEALNEGMQTVSKEGAHWIIKRVIRR